ncbi:hypothetical protein [Stutzerimonas stutzeri]|uniref:hypothetical protein n=1 Tax=Stutzerimonas stutzeri TaxID=316 RepID=UPI000396945A|nr:hypothetical protein [Stutzerimonas stutzeri]EQM72920.1 hypothetical protein L686_22730 [Stutzerimonas stutzeri MF28]
MFAADKHVIHLTDGRLSPKSSTSWEDVRRIVSLALQANAPAGIVLHFHGGLVSEASARATAEQRLYPLYAERSGGYPIFFIWESGFFEAPLNNLKEIANEALFKEFMKKAAEWTLKTLPSGIGFKGAGGASINEAKLREDFDAWFSGQRSSPPDQLELIPGTSDVEIVSKSKGAALDEEDLKDNIVESIEGDPDFQDAVQRTFNGLHPGSEPRPVSRGAGSRVSTISLVSKEAAERLFDVQTGTTKGLGPISWIKTAKVVAGIVIRVIRRFRSGRDHGLYVTLVEEILRELYVDKIGRTGWWDRMKGDTADAFKSGQEYGGTAFLTELKAQLEGVIKPPRITLVGHSTGAIYICHLLKAAAEHMPDLHFDVIFEAPAVTQALLAATAAEHASRVRSFRQFAMSDQREIGDKLVPVLYLSSLLYFVSGMLEHEPDEPLAGMGRYFDKAQIYHADAFPNIAACRRFYARYPNSLVWSPSNVGPGLGSDGCRHGDFDDADELTVASVQHILQHGF